MGDWIEVPPCVACTLNREPAFPSHRASLSEANIWMSFSDPNDNQSFTSTTLHNDMNNAVMCLYAGRKDWVFVDSRANVDSVRDPAANDWKLTHEIVCRSSGGRKRTISITHI